MITDPVSYENSSSPWGYRYHSLRGSCIFTSRRDLRVFSGAERRGQGDARFRDDGCGLRLSLTLPCNTTTGVVQ